MAQDSAHAAHRTDRAHRSTGAKWPRTLQTQHNAPSGHSSEVGPSGPEHCTRKTMHRGSAPANRNQVAQDTVHGRHSEQEPSGPGHRTRNTTHRARTPVNRSQEAQDTAHRTHRTHHARTPVNKRQVVVDTAHTRARSATKGQETTNQTQSVGCTGATQPDPAGQQQGWYRKAAGPGPARLHRGPWQT